MKIRINGKTVELFDGARVMDALRKYSRADLESIKNKNKKIVDSHGHRLELDGELSEGDEFYIKVC